MKSSVLGSSLHLMSCLTGRLWKLKTEQKKRQSGTFFLIWHATHFLLVSYFLYRAIKLCELCQHYFKKNLFECSKKTFLIPFVIKMFVNIFKIVWTLLFHCIIFPQSYSVLRQRKNGNFSLTSWSEGFSPTCRPFSFLDVTSGLCWKEEAISAARFR